MIKLNPEEKIIKIYRKHWYVILMQAIVFSFAILAILMGGAILFFKINDTGLKMLVLFATITILNIMIISFFVGYANYWLDAWLVTNERIVDIEQKSFFVRDFAEFKLSKIQDVVVTVAGVFPTFLNFGNVKIETASENETLIFEDIPNPYQAKSDILALCDEYIKSHSINSPI